MEAKPAGAPAAAAPAAAGPAPAGAGPGGSTRRGAARGRGASGGPGHLNYIALQNSAQFYFRAPCKDPFSNKGFGHLRGIYQINSKLEVESFLQKEFNYFINFFTCFFPSSKSRIIWWQTNGLLDKFLSKIIFKYKNNN